jgi:hypothetical protein
MLCEITFDKNHRGMPRATPHAGVRWYAEPEVSAAPDSAAA